MQKSIIMKIAMISYYSNYPRCFYRRRGKDNFFRCTYVLPDGVTHTKGFIKDPKEAQRYLTLYDGAPSPEPGMEETNQLDITEKPEDKSRVDLTKNVLFPSSLRNSSPV